MDIALLIIGCMLIVLVLSALFDLKTLEVPDWVTYGGIAVGMIIHIVLTITQATYWPALSSGLGIGAGYLIGALMYYTGQWGGGDAKLLMAVGALLGVEFDITSASLAFLINLIFAGAIWGIGYLLVLGARHAHKSFRVFNTLRHKHNKALLLNTILAGIILAAALLTEYTLPLAALAFLCYGLTYLGIFAKSVELACMHHWISADKLVEGDWLVHPFMHGNKIIAKPSKTGLSIKEVRALKDIHKKQGIGKICVKYGIPFTPAFLVSYLFTLAFGNLLVLAIHL